MQMREAPPCPCPPRSSSGRCPAGTARPPTTTPTMSRYIPGCPCPTKVESRLAHWCSRCLYLYNLAGDCALDQPVRFISQWAPAPCMQETIVHTIQQVMALDQLAAPAYDEASFVPAAAPPTPQPQGPPPSPVHVPDGCKLCRRCHVRHLITDHFAATRLLSLACCSLLRLKDST